MCKEIIVFIEDNLGWWESNPWVKKDNKERRADNREYDQGKNHSSSGRKEKSNQDWQE